MHDVHKMFWYAHADNTNDHVGDVVQNQLPCWQLSWKYLRKLGMDSNWSKKGPNQLQKIQFDDLSTVSIFIYKYKNHII